MSWPEIEFSFGPEGIRDFTPHYGHDASITDMAGRLLEIY
jgi:hypothetical protein